MCRSPRGSGRTPGSRSLASSGLPDTLQHAQPLTTHTETFAPRAHYALQSLSSQRMQTHLRLTPAPEGPATICTWALSRVCRTMKEVTTAKPSRVILGPMGTTLGHLHVQKLEGDAAITSLSYSSLICVVPDTHTG